MADSVIDCSPMSEVSTASTTAHTEENHVDESPRGIAVMVVVGVLVGLLSGLFGIGGGTIIVPALVWLPDPAACGRHFDVGDCAHLGVWCSGLCG